MIKNFTSLDELKRGVYLWVLPFVTLAVIVNTFISLGNRFDVFLNVTMGIWFVFSWGLAYTNRWVRFGEYSNLLLVSFYHITCVFLAVHDELAATGEGSLGDFIVWMPLIIMFIFLTLGTKKGFRFAIFLFLVNFGIGARYIFEMSPESMDSLAQFYFANIVYVLVLYYAQNIFHTYAEINLFKKYAYHDALTRIANRHKIDQCLEEKLIRADEEQGHFSAIFFDLDHFKKVNDRFGHKTGDFVLTELSELVAKQLSKNDLFGRWGGEEFIIITEVNGEKAFQYAERLRKTIELHTFKGAGSLTSSFGVTEYHKGDNSDTLLNRADEALYLSKNNGRNRVTYI